MLKVTQLVGFGGLAGEEGKPNVNAVDFDGASDYLSRASDLTGDADSSQGILSVWMRLDSAPSTPFIIGNDSAYFSLHMLSNKLRIESYDSAAANRFTFKTVNSYTSTSGWMHLLAAWDTNFSAGNKLSHLYINDSSDITVEYDGDSAFNIDYTRTIWEICSRAGGANKFDGAIAELYFAPGHYLDFSDSSNRRKFITAGGKPVDLGADGSTPTGSQPILYLPNTAASVGTNAGTGGNFTINGSPVIASSSPSD